MRSPIHRPLIISSIRGILELPNDVGYLCQDDDGRREGDCTDIGVAVVEVICNQQISISPGAVTCTSEEPGLNDDVLNHFGPGIAHKTKYDSNPILIYFLSVIIVFPFSSLTAP